MYQNDAMKVLTGEVRLSYANLTTPRAAQQGGEPKYSVTLLIPKSDAATKADIDAAIQAAASDALAKVWNGARPCSRCPSTMVTACGPPVCPLMMSARAIG